MKVRVKLGLAKKSNALILLDAEKYVTKIKNNAKFNIASIQEQVTLVDNARIMLHDKMVTLYPDIDEIRSARNSLNEELRYLAAMIEKVANDPKVADIDRLSIIHAAGMVAIEYTHPLAKVFTAVCGVLAGSVILKAPGSILSHQWEYTTDITGYTNRIELKTTSVATLEVNNLPVKTEIAFFHKPNIVGKDTDWEGPVTIMVI